MYGYANFVSQPRGEFYPPQCAFDLSPTPVVDLEDIAGFYTQYCADDGNRFIRKVDNAFEKCTQIGCVGNSLTCPLDGPVDIEDLASLCPFGLEERY